MGFHFANFEYLIQKNFLNNDSSILDVGSQNLYNATHQEIIKFVKTIKKDIEIDDISEEAKRISYFTTPRPGERTAYISEIIDLTNIKYTSFDVCPALKTEILDLNFEDLPTRYRESFDIVLNFGTTEHIINQLNCFRVMHDAMKVGGISFHQLPCAGWVNHGYYLYHLLFFQDLAKANDYEIVDYWYMPAGQCELPLDKMRMPESPLTEGKQSGVLTLLNFNLNIILRKKISCSFKIKLELETSHSALSKEASQLYLNGKRSTDK